MTWLSRQIGGPSLFGEVAVHPACPAPRRMVSVANGPVDHSRPMFRTADDQPPSRQLGRLLNVLGIQLLFLWSEPSASPATPALVESALLRSIAREHDLIVKTPEKRVVVIYGMQCAVRRSRWISPGRGPRCESSSLLPILLIGGGLVVFMMAAKK